MDKYELLETIGEGTYGTVLKAKHKESGLLLAIKKFKESDEEEQVRKIAHREIRLLKSLRHHHIVNLFEVVKRNHTFYLVFEYVERTLLSDLERNPEGLDSLTTKKLMYQLVHAIKYCHEHNVVHRDIKPENILLSRAGVLKLCDFGFARVLSGSHGRYTDYVSTRWYRAPELLVGDTGYGKGVDIWGIGCMLAEMSTGLPLFPGESDIDTLHLIMKVCGEKLAQQHLEAFMANPMYQGVDLPRPNAKSSLEDKLSVLDPLAIDFIKLCLAYEPSNRPSCEELLNHPYFDHEFKVELEQEIANCVALELQERRAFHVPSINSDSNTPEPFRDLKREVTPRRNIVKGVGTLQLIAEDMIPSSLARNVEGENEPRHNSFLPDLKTKRDESFASQFYLKKRRADRTFPKDSQKPKVKIVDLQSNMTSKLGTIQENFYDHYSFKHHVTLKHKTPSKSNLKPRTANEMSALQVHAVQVPSSHMRSKGPAM